MQPGKNPPPPRDGDVETGQSDGSESVWKLLLKYIKMFWKRIFILIYALILLPIFVTNNIPEMRCLYVVLLMAGYWVTECLPLAVTSFLPMILFPLMGIMDSDKTSLCYMKEANMMFIGGLIIALAVEYCNLHTRVALSVIKLIGCSPRRLNLGLCLVTMFVSMWISNTAATAMMIPIVDATLQALEERGILQMYEINKVETANAVEEEKIPGKPTMCFFMSTAYAASIGGTGCIIGSGTNLAFKGLYEAMFPESPGLEFNHWMALNVPLMLVTMAVCIVWIQFWFLGLFRPNSKDAKIIAIGVEGEELATTIIKQKLSDMGPVTFHEKSVGLMFILAIMLWVFRKPQFVLGWTERITDLKVKDSNPALIVSMLLFILPASTSFIHMFSKDEEKRPKAAAPPLVTWKYIQGRMSWGLVILLGGGFALAEASKASGLNKMIANYLKEYMHLNKIYIMIIAGSMGAFLTQFAANVAVANVILPVLAETAVIARMHPIYLMMPAALCCSYAYCLPVSTPPNAIAGAPCNMPTWEMVKIGFFLTLLSMACCFIIFPFLAPVVWDMSEFPEWAERK